MNQQMIWMLVYRLQYELPNLRIWSLAFWTFFVLNLSGIDISFIIVKDQRIWNHIAGEFDLIHLNHSKWIGY